jgi:hypothetical protein
VAAAADGRIRLGASRVDGRLPPEIIQRTVRGAGAYGACYDDGLTRDPALAGRVTLHFMIDRAGRVGRADATGSTLPDADVVACFVAATRTLKFPEPEGGVVTVTLPLLLSPTPPDAG